ncbi:hypothetical protein HYDPIDRAFT_102367, partial [Hydnomerulius pinastri MD-312]
EHAFAALKGRFQSLRELRLQIQTEKDVHIAVYWVMCCLILHNMIIRFEEQRRVVIAGTMEWAIQEGRGSEDDGGGGVCADPPRMTPGQKFRERLMERLFRDRGFHF